MGAKEFKRENQNEYHLEELRYSALLSNYFDTCMEVDKATLNWSTLAIIGLLVLGVVEQSLCGQAMKVFWGLAVFSFFMSCLLIRVNMGISSKQRLETLSYFLSEAPVKNKKRGVWVGIINTVYTVFFFLGLGFSVVFVALLIF
jgi:hypothetical protein